MSHQNKIRCGLKGALVAVALFAAQSALAAPLDLTDGDKVTLNWGAGTYGHADGGGEFLTAGVGGSVLNGAGDSFLTFCLEFNSHISLGTPYYVAINTVANPGGGVAATYVGDVAGTAGVSDPLSHATAWLYTQFRTNHLQDYVAFNYTSDADVNSLQKAFWVLENEKPASFLDAKATQLFNAAVGAGWTDNGNVRVMQLWETRSGTLGNYTFSGDHQDQLYMIPVPEPETYAMMLAGLGLMGFVARRRRQDGQA